MLKGCQKKIIMIKDTGSDIFDQAYFILKDAEKSERWGKTDMIREANRIIDNNLLGAYFSEGKKKRSRSFDRLSFYLGSVAGSAVVALLWVIVAGT